ncbi:smyd2-a [Symbiodinium sp. CCMP2592]|nr:smyd2-a [Symbiodinium sp. CCMP2592]
MRARLLIVVLGSCLAAIVGNFVLNSDAGTALSGGLLGRRPAVHRTSRYAKGRQSSLDVRGLLQKAGLILPEPTETFVSESEDDSLEIEAPIPLLQQGLSQRLTEVIGEIEENWPNKEAVVPEDEDIELETPLQNLDVPLQWLERNFDIRPKQEELVSEKKALRFETPLSALFPGVLEEAFESTETWTDLLLPLLDAESVLVDSMDESNYVTVTLEKPLGIQIEENPPQLGGGVAVKSIKPGSNAARSQLIQPGYQLLAASGIAVHGLHLEDASRPIEAAQGRVQLTFFNGSAETFYGLLGPDPEWLSAFLRKLQMEHFAWSFQEGLAPKKSWSWALELLEELRSQSGVDVQTLHSAYGAAMEACQRASRWEPALELLSEIRRLPKTRPTAANYRSAILACERAGEMLKALWLLEEMLEAGLKPDRATYNSAVGACRAILRSPARGDRGRSVTESGWRASSRSKDLPSVQLPGMPIQWDAGIDLQLRSRNASPGPSLAAKRRAVSVGSFERQVTRSSSQGALSSAGFHALRPLTGGGASHGRHMGRRFRHLGLEVRQDAKGRGLYCTRSFRQGETLFVGEAALLVCLPDLWKNCCSKCLASSFDADGLRICQGCGTAAFCSCCWGDPWHSEECPVLAKLLEACKDHARSRGIEEHDHWQQLVCCALSISRLLRLLHSGREPKSAPCAKLAVALLEDFAELCTPPEDIPGDPQAFAALLMGEPLNALFPAELRHSPELVDVICHCYEQLTCNSFLVCSGDATPAGQLCDPIAALLNHSCSPNAAIVWQIPAKGRTHRVQCIRDLSAGDEVLISYVDATRPWWIRQPSLKATYGFICDCAVCRPISAWERSVAVGARPTKLPAGIEESIAAVKAADGTILMISAERTRALGMFLRKEMGINVEVASDKDICRVADAAAAVGQLAGSPGQLNCEEARNRLLQLRPAWESLLQLLGPRHMLLRELISVLCIAEIAEDWKTCMELAPKVLTALGIPDEEMSSRKAEVLALLAIAKIRTAEDGASQLEAQSESKAALESMVWLYGENLPKQSRVLTLQHLLHENVAMDLDSMD